MGHGAWSPAPFSMLKVHLNEQGTNFVATGGDPRGGDRVNAIVATWPGWRRIALRDRGAVGSTFVGPCSITSALALSSTTLELRWEERAAARADDILGSFRKARQALEGSRGAHFIPPTARKPLPYQYQGVSAMHYLDCRCWLSDDMGLGKTSQVLWTAHVLGATRVLVLCPSSVKFNWPREIEQTLGPSWGVSVIDGTPKQRATQFAELDALWKRYQKLCIVVGYGLLGYLPDAQLTRLQRFVQDQFLVMDEGHYLKNSDAGRTKVVRSAFCPADGGAKWRVLVTGTPIRNTVEDVYSLAELVRPGTFYSKHWFLNRFTVQSVIKVGRSKRINKRIVRKAKNVKELNVILNSLQIRRKKEDVTDLPPKTFTYPELELDSYTGKIYAAMRDYALLLLEEHDPEMPILSPTCKTAVEAAVRCEQIAQGCIGGVPERLLSSLSSHLSRGGERVRGRDGWLVFPKSTKIQWLLEQLNTVRLQGGRSVVFGRFNAPLLWLEQYHDNPERGRAVTGEMGASQRKEVFDAFQAGKIQELYIQVRIAEGFNLHRARDEFFLGRDWAPAVNAQAVDRCHRIGQTGTVNIQMPFVRKTIEVRQHEALAAKQRDAAHVLVFQTIKDLQEALR